MPRTDMLKLRDLNSIIVVSRIMTRQGWLMKEVSHCWINQTKLKRSFIGITSAMLWNRGLAPVERSKTMLSWFRKITVLTHLMVLLKHTRSTLYSRTPTPMWGCLITHKENKMCHQRKMTRLRSYLRYNLRKVWIANSLSLLQIRKASKSWKSSKISRMQMLTNLRA